MVLAGKADCGGGIDPNGFGGGGSNFLSRLVPVLVLYGLLDRSIECFKGSQTEEG
jgi:hypothetical protein